MKSLWMLPLLILLALVTCARVALAEPEDPPVVFCDDTEIFNPDAVSGADPAYSLVSYQPTGRDGLMDPFAADAAPSSTPATTDTPDPGKDPGAFATAIISAAKAGKWLLFFGLFLVGVTWAARTALAKKWSWFGTDRGGVVTTLAVTFLSTLSGSMMAGIFDWTVILPAAATFLAGAVAVYVLPKKGATPSPSKVG